MLHKCRFYLCLWFKDDPLSEERIVYYLARLKSKEILRDSSSNLLLSRSWAKKICLALGQHSSFSRGFDTILSLLLVNSILVPLIILFSLYKVMPEFTKMITSGKYEGKFSYTASKGPACGEHICFVSHYRCNCFPTYLGN